MNNDNFVCFDCRISLRYPKYSDTKPNCPHCHKPCDHLGDRCPIPAKNKVKEWQALQTDYHQLQKRIIVHYQKWQNQLKSAIEWHLALAEQLGYTELVEQDKLWLCACENLAKVPYAYDKPLIRDWLKYANDKYAVAWSDIGKPNLQIEHLKQLPYNKERQKYIEKLWLDHNSLHIFDMFSQLYVENYNHPLQKTPKSLLGSKEFFGNYRKYFPILKS